MLDKNHIESIFKFKIMSIITIFFVDFYQIKKIEVPL